MGTQEKIMEVRFSIQWLIDLFLVISLLSLVSIPLALARETQNSAVAKDQTQPAVPAISASEPENTMTRALDSYEGNDSINFLMESSLLSGGTITEAAPQIMAPEPLPANNTGLAPVTLEVLQGRVVEEADEVAMLVSEQCSQNGNAVEGVSSCTRIYSNGHHAAILTQNANEGDEVKHQTVIEEFDEDDTLLYKKTIRHRMDYNYLNDRKAKEKEFFDIIYQPTGKKTTRELMVYEYFLDTGKPKSLSWTQYKQIANESKAGLVYHASLRYGNDGNPARGIAEMWDNGKKIETFMDWNRRAAGFAMLDEEAWGQWEGWIRSVSLQAYLP